MQGGPVLPVIKHPEYAVGSFGKVKGWRYTVPARSALFR